MSRRPPRWPAAALALACSVLAAGVARAQELADPTRPPPESLLAAGVQTAPVVPPGPQLQSILVARQPGGRSVAVIDGQTLRVGERVHGAVLARIGDGEVELRRGSHSQLLKLFPKPAPKAAATPAASHP